nr:hypothetical protein [Amphibacillus sediminis]
MSKREIQQLVTVRLVHGILFNIVLINLLNSITLLSKEEGKMNMTIEELPETRIALFSECRRIWRKAKQSLNGSL